MFGSANTFPFSYSARAKFFDIAVLDFCLSPVISTHISTYYPSLWQGIKGYKKEKWEEMKNKHTKASRLRSTALMIMIIQESTEFVFFYLFSTFRDRILTIICRHYRNVKVVVDKFCDYNLEIPSHGYQLYIKSITSLQLQNIPNWSWVPRIFSSKSAPGGIHASVTILIHMQSLSLVQKRRGKLLKIAVLHQERYCSRLETPCSANDSGEETSSGGTKRNLVH